MNYLPLIVISTIIIIPLILLKQTFEFYSPGAITQLTAKGLQDTHLTDDAWKYLYSPLYPYYMYYSWPYSISTRLRKSQHIWPFYIGEYPYYHYVFNY